MKFPVQTKINIPTILTLANTLSLQGSLGVTKDNLTYLNIDDKFIHDLFPLLKNPRIKKPAYFGKGLVGAHISVIYPEENICVEDGDLMSQHVFSIKEFISAEMGQKKYYALLIKSPGLLALRRKYDLPDLLDFKGYAIDFHITIGVELTS